MLRIAQAGLLLVAVMCARPAMAREWTNTAGKTIEAELVSSDATSVHLKRPNGKTVKIARSQLSQHDREWLDLQTSLAAAEPAEPLAAAVLGPDDERAKSLEALGAKVERDVRDPHRPIVAVDMHGLQILDGHLELLKGLEPLKRLDLSGCYITASDPGLAHLATLSGLEELTFYDAREGNDRWLAPLGNLTNLKSLNLDVPLLRFFPVIHDKGIANLQPLTKIERLRLSGWEITDKSMPYLEQMTNLRELELIWTKVSNAGIASLKRFPHLRRLWIRNESFLDDDGLKVLADLPELEFLMLSGYRFTGEALKHAHSKNLREVGIEGQDFGDEVFVYLQAMPNLEAVHFSNALVTDRGLPALNKLKKLKAIEISQCTINGPGLMALKSLKQLQSLQYAGYAEFPSPPEYKIAPDVLQCLQNFPALETLAFNRSLVGNRGIVYLKHVPKLKQLQLGSAQINEEGMVHLEPLKDLESLNLTSNKVVGPGLARLNHMQKLEHLIIPNPVTDEGLRHISELRALRELDLTSAKITDDAMPMLAHLTNLEQLSLLYCAEVTDKGIASLSGMRELRELQLFSDHVSDAMIPHLLKLSELRVLHIISTHKRVTGAGVDQLATLPNLRRLWLDNPDRGAVGRLYERNPRVIVFAGFDAPLLRGAKW